MAASSITLTANDPDATSLTILDGTGVTGTWTLVGANWGNAVWDTTYGGARGTLGSRPSAATIGNREVRLQLRCFAGTPDSAAAALAALAEQVDRLRQNGGRITVKHSSQSYRQHLEVYAGSATLGDWTNRAEFSGTHDVGLAFVCGPYVLGDSMWVTDRFDTDTESDYTIDFGSAGAVSVGSGQFKTTTTGTPTVAIHSAIGYQYGDHQAQAKCRLASITNAGAGVTFKRTAGGTHLAAYAFDNGGTSRLYLEKWVGSAVTILGTSAPFGTRLAIGVPYFVVGRVEGNTVYAEYWDNAAMPQLGGSPAVGLSYSLTGSDITTFGEGAAGQAGPFLRPGNASDSVEEFEIRPYVYKGGLFPGSNNFRHQGVDNWRLAGDIPGDAPALMTIDLYSGGFSGDWTRFGLIGWSSRPDTHSLIPDGSFERGIPTQWAVTAVTGVLANAGTSISAATGGRYGQDCAQIVCPATANSGAAARIPRRFRAGVTYTVEGWVRAASGTTNVRLRLGVNGDIASTTAAALNTQWVKHTTTWTPTATVELAYVVAEVTAATATTWQIDGIMVYEGTAAPTSVTQRGGASGLPPFGILEAGEAVAMSNLTYTEASGSATTYRNGSYLQGSGTAAVGWAQFVLDPTLIPRDPVRGGLDMEVWLVGEELDGVNWITSASLPNDYSSGPPNTAATWSREFGSSGTSGGNSGGGALRLGTLPLDPPDRVGGPGEPPVPVILNVYNATGNISATRIDCVVLVPARGRALGVTNKTTAIPYLSGSTGSGQFTRRFFADLSGLQMSADPGGWRAMWGLGGALLEFPPGPVDVTTIITRRTPGGSTGTGTVYVKGAMAFTPVPRWHHLRDA